VDTIDVDARYKELTIAVAAKNLTSVTTFSLPNAMVDEVWLRFPPGHVGLMGVRLAYGGNTFIPWDSGVTKIVGDNERLVFIVGMYMTGPISILIANNDTVAHTMFVTVKWHTYNPSESAIQPLSLPVIVG
jgi:hypothetical protein